MTEIQEILALRESKASRSLTPPPEKLSRLLKLVNIVPPEAELPDLETKINCGLEIEPSLVDWANLEASVNWELPLSLEWKMKGAIDEILKSLPSLFGLYVVLGQERIFEILAEPKTDFYTDSNQDTEEYDIDRGCLIEEADADDKEHEKFNTNVFVWAIRYQIFRESREVLRRIARSASQGEKQIGGVSERGLLPTSFSIEIDENGHLRLIPPFYVALLEGVEAARIRECEICKRLFWAGRSDQLTCSTKCAKVRRTRIWRAKYPTDYKLQRIQRENEREAAAKNQNKSEKKKRG